MSTLKYYYTVPTDDKSISSVRSSVLAVGVALFFMYLVSVCWWRWIMHFKSLWLSFWTARRNREIESSISYCKHRECYIYMWLQVRSIICSHVLNISTLLLRTPLGFAQLAHSHHRHPHAHLLYRWEELQGKNHVVLHVLHLSPANRLLDHPSPHNRLHLVQQTRCRIRLILISSPIIFSYP